MAGCLKALRLLAQCCEQIVLPAPRAGVPRGETPFQLAPDVQLAQPVPPRPKQLRGLEIEPVTEGSQRRVWNTLIAREHRQGMTIFVGAQMRYLMAAECGWLGGVGFAAAALRLAVRRFRRQALLKKKTKGMGASRVAAVLRMGALTLQRSRSALGATFRRTARRKGHSVAVFALARKLADLVYRMLRYGQDYVDIGE